MLSLLGLERAEQPGARRGGRRVGWAAPGSLTPFGSGWSSSKEEEPGAHEGRS